MPIPKRLGWKKYVMPPRLPSVLNPLREWLQQVSALINELFSMVCDDVLVSTTEVVNTTTETEVYNKPLAPNSLRPKRTIKVNLFGEYSSVNNSDTVTIKVKVGGTVVGTVTTAAAVVTDAPVSIHCTITVRTIGSTGALVAYTEADLDNGGADNASTSETGIDTTTQNTIQVTATWSAADTGNTVSIHQGYTQIAY